MTNRYLGVDPLLTNFSIGYKNAEMIAQILLPDLAVKFDTGKHWIYDRGGFRTEETRRGQGAKSREVTHGLTTGLAYSCEDHAIKEFVSDEDVRNAAEGRDPYQDATENVTNKLLLGREVEAATMLRDTSILTQNDTLVGSEQWSDSNSDPVTAIREASSQIFGQIFQKPNVLMLSKQVFDKLQDHPAIVERVKYSQLGVLTVDLLARFFDVQTVIIGAAGQNSSVEGQADSMGFVWGKDAILAYVNPTIGQKTITMGLTYRTGSRTIERLDGSEERDRRGIFIRGGDERYDQKIVSPLCAFLFKNAVA